jgi:hypothetical protein
MQKISGTIVRLADLRALATPFSRTARIVAA